MLRLSRIDDCLWICDLPRRTNDPAAIRNLLEASGFRLLPSTADGLWRIDLSLEDAIFHIPAALPSVPYQDRLHTLYALCRLLEAHPAPLAEQPMPLMRAILKLTLLEPNEQARQASRLYTLCAERFNRRMPLPSSVCGILAETIQKEENA